MEYLDRLNKEQREAALHIDGPCLVMAGAGTGKTSVLTSRIAHLIDSGIKSENILAITFTNKAAKEMKERVDKLVGNNDATISTFHSFGLQIVKNNAKILGFDKKITILDDDDVISMIKKIVKDLGYDMKRDEIAPTTIKDAISRYKNKLIPNEKIEKEAMNATSLTEEIIPEVYERYIKQCKKYCYVDFDDLLKLPVELFTNNKNVLETYQDRFKYVLIDEYQDTNDVQYVLTKLLVSKYKNLFVVGDVNQSIYSFRGADYKNIINFKKDYPKAKCITLNQNYRSTNIILSAANSVIVNNCDKADVTLYSEKGLGDKIKYYDIYSEYDEASFVAKSIKNLINSGYQPSDIAILYRKNFQSRLYETNLMQNSVPFTVIGNKFFDKKEIKDFISYLKLISNKDNDLALKRVINVPKRGIGNKAVETLEEIAKTNNTSLFDAITSNKELAFKNLINYFINESEKMNLDEIVDMVLEDSGLIEMYKEAGSLEDRTRVQNLLDFRSVVYNYKLENPNGTLDDFLEELGLAEDVAKPKKDKNNVTLMTLHKAKGLEFPVVFIVGAEQGLFPEIRPDVNVEEERRLMYVGITRAKEKLFITSAKKRTVYGRQQISDKTMFINEINKKFIERYKQ